MSNADESNADEPAADPASLAAQLLHSARWMVGLTQAEVAHRSGVSQQMVAQYERGRRQPSIPTLVKLLAGCGLLLTCQLVPEPGLDDYSTLELLERGPLDRLDPRFASTVEALARTARDVDFVVGGKTAARMHGADVRVYEVEVWVADDVDLDGLACLLREADVEYISLSGSVGPPEPTVANLAPGYPLASRTAEVRLRSVPGFRLVAMQAIDIPLERCRTPLRVAAARDCDQFWYPRDPDRLALQRAIRLADRAQRT